MAVLFLKEEAKASRILGVLIGFSGVAAQSLGKISTIESLTYSSSFLIIGAFLWAVSIVYCKKILTHIDSIVTNVIQLVVGAIILTLLSAVFGGFYFPLSGAYISIVLYASIGASSFALTIWIFLLREEEATVLSSSSFIIPMAALFFGWLLLGENIELKSLLGTGLIMAGVYLVNRT